MLLAVTFYLASSGDLASGDSRLDLSDPMAMHECTGVFSCRWPKRAQRVLLFCLRLQRAAVETRVQRSHAGCIQPQNVPILSSKSNERSDLGSTVGCDVGWKTTNN